MDQAELDGMPEPARLRLERVDGQVLLWCGRSLLYRFEQADAGMRNLAIVSLTDAGRRVGEVAALFGLSATYVSILRGRARAQGSAGLVRRQGRPPKLSERQVERARRWAGQGCTQQVIAGRLGVAQSVISELLARRGVLLAAQPELHEGTPVRPAGTEPADGDTGAATAGGAAAEPDAEPGDDSGEAAADAAERAVNGPAAPFRGSARIGTGSYPCRYAGAMLLHPYLHRVDAQGIFATLCGGPARRYDDHAVLTAATAGFALGIDTIEGAKHLRRGDAGPAVGLRVSPELATLRSRLGVLADGADPLAVQRAFAARMLAADPAGDPVYFVDDHFVPYAGARPVAKGWNTKRRHAQPGRDDTMLVDARGRAVVFASGEPSGLSATLPGVLAQLRTVIGPAAPVLLGFDRGGAYPVAFRACRDADTDWVTYRRGPLAAATAAPRRSWTIRGGRRIVVILADETVHLGGYGDARQLTLFEHDKAVLQVLTSDTDATGADLLCWLRARWRIENMFKYASQHNGIDALADYRMDIEPDHRKVKNPARVAARKHLGAAEADLAAAERALPQLLADPEHTPKQKNAAIPAVQQRIRAAHQAVADAKAALHPIPATLPATDLNPDATLARPHLARRGLQMVLRLLAFNAEAWLADHLNAYLADPDEYRATTRNLLHQGGHIHYTPTTITVTLHRPDTPRIARALQLLTDELNTTPTRMPGDPRPITYQLDPARTSTPNPPLLQEV